MSCSRSRGHSAVSAGVGGARARWHRSPTASSGGNPRKRRAQNSAGIVFHIVGKGPRPAQGSGGGSVEREDRPSRARYASKSDDDSRKNLLFYIRSRSRAQVHNGGASAMASLGIALDDDAPFLTHRQQQGHDQRQNAHLGIAEARATAPRSPSERVEYLSQK